MNLDKDIFIVDDFYNNPDAIRELALSANYPKFDAKRNFPGQESEKSYYTDRHTEEFENILNKKISVEPDKFIYGKFRYSLVDDDARTKIHLDWNVDWTAIVYLSLNENIKGNLGIYRMKELNLDESPSNFVLKEKFSCDNIKDFDAKYVMPISKNLNKWDIIYEIPIKYNRLVLFKGSKYFHAITEQFGNSIEDGRITQNFFFNEL